MFGHVQHFVINTTKQITDKIVSRRWILLSDLVRYLQLRRIRCSVQTSTIGF
jgi:hypothetical protein